MSFNDKIEYNQEGTVLTMHCDDGSVKVFDRKDVMRRGYADPGYVWQLRTMAQYPKGKLETHYVDPLTGRSVRAAAVTRWWYQHGGYWTRDRDNAAKTWYYETYVKPRLKKEFE